MMCACPSNTGKTPLKTVHSCTMSSQSTALYCSSSQSHAVAKYRTVPSAARESAACAGTETHTTLSGGLAAAFATGLQLLLPATQCRGLLHARRKSTKSWRASIDMIMSTQHSRYSTRAVAANTPNSSHLTFPARGERDLPVRRAHVCPLVHITVGFAVPDQQNAPWTTDDASSCCRLGRRSEPSQLPTVQI
jgi:hypothetical protein